ncbi:hypothetical protein D3C73_1180730 [compost metagenome]
MARIGSLMLDAFTLPAPSGVSLCIRVCAQLPDLSMSSKYRSCHMVPRLRARFTKRLSTLLRDSAFSLVRLFRSRASMIMSSSRMPTFRAAKPGRDGSNA